MKPILIALVSCGLTMCLATPSHASPITSVITFGQINLACTDEMDVDCQAQDLLPGPQSITNSANGVNNVFTNIFNGGYRPGGAVIWDFDFDASDFTSIDAMTLQVDVVGLVDCYPGNIDPQQGQIGNYLAIDGVPFAPFLNNTDGRDSHTFVIPILAPGAHQFSVWVYEPPAGGTWPEYRHEGWAGVDYAQLTIDGDYEGERWDEVNVADVTPVPEPATLTLLGSGIAAVAAARRRRSR